MTYLKLLYLIKDHSLCIQPYNHGTMDIWYTS